MTFPGARQLFRFRGCVAFVAVICAIACPAIAPARAQTSAEPTPAGNGRNVMQITPGTILPVRLNHGLSSKNTRVGQPVSGRVMQAVPLPGGGRLSEGTKVRGTVVAVKAAGKGGAGEISLRFTQVESNRQTVPLAASLRAIASFMQIQYAETPDTSPGFGTPYPWQTFNLIGGDVKYGVGGPVTDRGSRTIGEGTADGALVRIRASPDGSCRGEPEGSARLQAVWVFSSDACGVYGMSGVKIVHAGRTAPVGTITLAAQSGDVNVRGGAAMLLRVVH